MKKFLIPILTLFILFGFITDINGQWVTGKNASVPINDKEKVIEFHGRITGSTTYDTLTSNGFSVFGFNHLLYTYPIYGSILLSNGTVSTQKVSCYWLATNVSGGTPAVIDTICYKDSSISEIPLSINLNNKHYRFNYLKFCKETGNVTTDYKLTLILWKKE